MVENVTQKQEEVKRDPQYQAFIEAGGSLPEFDFARVIELLQDMSKTPLEIVDIVREALPSTVQQFDNIAWFSKQKGIEFSREQKALYCFLRRYDRKDGIPVISEMDGLSDQRVVADIVLMTGSERDYNAFLGTFSQPDETPVERAKRLANVSKYISGRPDYTGNSTVMESPQFYIPHPVSTGQVLVGSSAVSDR